MKKITDFVKQKLGLAARIGRTNGLGGAVDSIEQPEYASACGLMLIDSSSQQSNRGKKGTHVGMRGGKQAKDSLNKARNGAKNFFSKFKI